MRKGQPGLLDWLSRHQLAYTAITMHGIAVTFLSIFLVSVSISCSSSNAPTKPVSQDASTNNSSSDLAAATGVFLVTQAADSSDCSSDPLLRDTSLGEYYRFTPTIQNGEQVIIEEDCGSSASCDNPSPYTWHLNDAGVWTRSGGAAWTTSPTCKYTTARFTLDISSNGLLRRQLSYEAPLDLVNGQCPQTVAQNTTCSHIYLLYMTRVN